MDDWRVCLFYYASWDLRVDLDVRGGGQRRHAAAEREGRGPGAGEGAERHGDERGEARRT